jgi:hypothetical protein
VQDDPSAARLLSAIADCLEQDVLPRTEVAVQHTVRVAANLCRIVAREVELEPAADERARGALSGLVGHDGTSVELWRALADLLTPASALQTAASLAATDELAQLAHPVVLSVVRDKLAVAKPGYDDYDFTGEQR